MESQFLHNSNFYQILQFISNFFEINDEIDLTFLSVCNALLLTFKGISVELITPLRVEGILVLSLQLNRLQILDCK